MKKKRTLQKVTMAAGVVAMSVGLFNSFDLEAQTTGGGSSACTSGPVGDDAYMLCDYKKQWGSTNCKVKVDYTCLLRDTGPGWPNLP